MDHIDMCAFVYVEVSKKIENKAAREFYSFLNLNYLIIIR